jgi:putative flippase GtrA
MMEISNNLTKNKSVSQFSKFFVVGILNTAIDFSILNFLMWATKTYEGAPVAIYNTVSFSIAVINSYILNKYWTFEDKSSAKTPAQFIKFLTVAVIGWGLNTGVLYSITTYVNPLFGLGAALWANLAKAFATGAVLAWNFIGYKFLVFKK